MNTIDDNISGDNISGDDTLGELPPFPDFHGTPLEFLYDVDAFDRYTLKWHGITFPGPELDALAANALTVIAWRNTELEDIHAGVYVDEKRYEQLADETDDIRREEDAVRERLGYLPADKWGIRDGDMLRLNSFVAETVAQAAGTGFDLYNGAQNDLFAEGHYPVETYGRIQKDFPDLVLGDLHVPAAKLFGKAWGPLSQSMAGGLSRFQSLGYLVDPDIAVRMRALGAASFARNWRGTPWWPELVGEFTTANGWTAERAAALRDRPWTLDYATARKAVRDIRFWNSEPFFAQWRTKRNLPDPSEDPVGGFWSLLALGG